MNFSGFSRKRNEKASSKKNNPPLNTDLLGVDLFCELTHLSAIASSGLSRSQIFEQAANLPYQSARYFKEVHQMALRLNYDYGEACRVVGEKTREQEPRGLLLRMSGALVSGEQESEFLAREAYVLGESYGNEYERAVERAKIWTDAYVALVLSSAMVVVISAVSMVIFPVPTSFVLVLGGSMLMVTVFGAWLMYRASPKEVKTHSLPLTSVEQTLARFLFKVSVPTAVAVCLMLSLIGVPMGWVMLVGAVVILPSGLMAQIDDVKVDRRDEDIAGFLRSLGGISKAIGSTLTDAMGRMDMASLHSLELPARRLYRRLRLGLNPDVCWERFISETGSEHVNRSVRIFWNGIFLGGDAQVVGNQSSMFALKVSLLRTKRRMLASSFGLLCIAVHAAISALLVCIYQVMLFFTSSFQQASAGIGSGATDTLENMDSFSIYLGSGQLTLLHTMTILMILVLTVTNAVAIKVVGGGSALKYVFYLSILLAISGLCLALGPGMVMSLFPTAGPS